MTISELAKIALDEGRVVCCRRKKYDDNPLSMATMDLDPFAQFGLELECEELVADDWYEVFEK